MEDWTKRMNDVMDYVEEHLGEEVDEDTVGKIMGSSYSSFQSTFTQITDLSFAEYIRRRKLTCAAYDLQNTDEKIIDIGLKYGYQSPDAFSAAFKRLHGIAPSEARKFGVTLTFYCRLKFEITIKGVEKMKYEILDRDPFEVIGIRRTTPYGAGTWAIVKSDGSNEKMKEVAGKFFDLGLCFGFKEDGSNDYMCAVDWNQGPLDGYDYYKYPAATWLRFEAIGTITDNTLTNVWRQINEEFLPQSKYSKCGLPTIERYVVWNEAEDLCNVEIWIPVAA